MKTRTFGKTGVQVSEVGLGCWQLGGVDFGPMSDAQAFDLLSAALEEGVRFFDTADVYGAGRSESLIGRFLRERARKDDVFVATKLGRYGRTTGAGWVREATETSMIRLGVQALDLTQVHCLPLSRLRDGHIFGELRALQREGKIRHFGASVESIEEALFCLEQPGLSSLQVIFNVFRQRPAEKLFAAARSRGVAIIVRLPLASGLLGGRFTRETRFLPSDHRSYNRDGAIFNVGETFAGLPFEKGVELVEKLRAIAPPGYTLAQLALRFCLDFDEVSVVIPGATRLAQVRENVSASALAPLPEAVHQELRSFYRTEVEPAIRGAY